MYPTEMNTAALFDLDGVVIDTESQYTLFWKGVGDRDFPDTANFAHLIKGSTLVEIFKEYYPGDERAQERIRRELSEFEARMRYEYVPGVISFLQQLRNEGVRTAVVTSSNKDKMASLYAARPEIKDLFDHIFTAEDARASKPAPDCYIGAARHFGYEPEECYVFEDSLNGLRAGLSSGAMVVGLATSHPEERIRQLCHCCIKDFTAFTVKQMFDIKK